MSTTPSANGSTDGLDATPGQESIHGEVSLAPVLDGLGDFIDGSDDATGLQGALDDIRSSKDLLQAASSVLGFAGQVSDTASAVQDLTEGLEAALKVVVKLSSVFGSAFKAATDIISKGLDQVGDAAEKLEHRLENIVDTAGKLQLVIDEAIGVIEEVVEPNLIESIAQGDVLRATVRHLDDTIHVLETPKFEIVAPGQQQTPASIALRLEGAAGQLKSFAEAFEEGAAARGDLVARANAIPGQTVFGAVAGANRALGHTVEVINTAADVMDRVNDKVGFLLAPMEIVATVVRPIAPLLNAASFVFNAVVAPVLNPVLRATHIDRLLEPVADLFNSFTPNVAGVENFSGQLSALTGNLSDLADFDRITEGLSQEDKDALRSEAETAAADAAVDIARDGALAVANLAVDVVFDRFVETSLAQVQRATVSNVDREGNTYTGDVVLADAFGTTLTGGNGDDILVDDGRDMTLAGGAGSDVFIMDEGDDRVEGGAGDDYAVYADRVTEFRFLFGEGADGKVEITIVHLNPDDARSDQGTDTFVGVEHFHFDDLGLAELAIDEIIQLEGDEGVNFEDTQPNGTGAAPGVGENVDIVFGSTGDNDIRTGSGDDFIVTGGGRDTVRAGDGNDIVAISGDVAAIDIDGGAGRDVISAVGVDQDLRFDLGLVPDATQAASAPMTSYVDVTASYAVGDAALLRAGATMGAVSGARVEVTRRMAGFEDVLGGDGNDTIIGNDVENALFGNAGDDTIEGGGGGDVLNGGLGNDRLTGGAGDDILIGGSGDDTFFGLNGTDQISGGAGFDRLDISAQGNDQVIDLTGTGAVANVIEGVEGLTTGGGDDRVTLTDELDELVTGAGRDTVHMRGGDANGVQVDTGSGTDTLEVTLDNLATIDLGAGDDTAILMMAAGALDGAAISLSGGGGTDTFRAQTGVTGPPDGAADPDSATAPAISGVRLRMTGIEDTLIGTATDSAGHEAALSLEGFEKLRLSDLADRIDGRMNLSEIYGGGGDDVIDVSGNVTGKTSFSVGGQLFARLVDGGAGNDVLTTATLGSTLLIGGAGDDVLDATGLSDRAAFTPAFSGILDSYARFEGGEGLDGGAGDDLFRLGAAASGSLAISGGDGTDTMEFSASASGITVDLGAAIATADDGSFSIAALQKGANKVFFDMFFATTQSAVANAWDGGFGVENVVGSAFGDTLIGDSGDNVIDGAAGDDSLSGGAGDDVVSGGAGTDLLEGGAGDDVLLLGTGLDGLIGGTDTLDGGTSDADGDTASFTDGAALVGVSASLATGHADARVLGLRIAQMLDIENLVGTGLDDQLVGDDRANLLYANAGDDLVLGLGGDDTLVGGGGDDALFGGDGADTFAGGAGENTLSGGAGDDTFLLDGGVNVILGGAGQDALEVQTILVDQVVRTTAVNPETGEEITGTHTETARSRFELIEEDGTLTVVHLIDLLDGETGATAPTELGRAVIGADVEEIRIFEPDAEGNPVLLRSLDVGALLADTVTETPDGPLPLPVAGGVVPEPDTTRTFTPITLEEIAGANGAAVANTSAPPQTVALSNGDFLVIFPTRVSDATGVELKAQRFTADGDAVGGPMDLPMHAPGTFGRDLVGQFDVLLLEGDLLAVAAANQLNGVASREAALVTTNVFDLSGGGIVEVAGHRGVYAGASGAFSPSLSGTSIDTVRLNVVFSNGGSPATGAGFDGLGEGSFGPEDADGPGFTSPTRGFGTAIDSAQLSNGSTVEVFSAIALLDRTSAIRITDAQGSVVSSGSIGFGDAFPHDTTVTALANGNFVVTATTSRETNSTRARILDAQGKSLTGAFLVGDTSRNDKVVQAEIVALGDGGFIALYTRYGTVSGQRFSAEGARLGETFTVGVARNADTPASAALLEDGRIAVSFLGFASDGETPEIRTVILSDVRHHIEGDNGADEIAGTDRADHIEGKGGDDIIDAGAENDEIHGDDGDDLIVAGAGDDDARGGGGADRIIGGQGDDTLQGNDGDDILVGGAGQDRLFGGDGRDILSGGAGDDMLHGGAGDDRLDGGRGDDALTGGTGRDTLDGGEGDDVLTGAEGGDRFVFATDIAELADGSRVRLDAPIGFGRDTITDFDVLEDVIDLTRIADPTGFTLTQTAQGVRIAIGESEILLEGVTPGALSAGNFDFGAIDAAREVLTGGAGADLLIGDGYLPFVGGNLVRNGDFGTGDLSDWTVLNPTGGRAPGVASAEGAVALNAGGEGRYGDGLSQQLATAPGATYDVTVVLGQRGGDAGDHTALVEILDATGAVIASRSAVVSRGETEAVTFGFTATGTATDIRITNPTSTRSSGTDLLIDTVSVEQSGAPAGDDVISGGDGRDTIHGDGGRPELVRESFNWEGLSSAQAKSGVVRDTGSVEVTYTVLSADGFTSAISSKTINVAGIDAGSDRVDTAHSLVSDNGSNGHTSVREWAFSEPVYNVAFNITDIDHADEVTIRAFDAGGNAIPVRLTAGSKVALSDTDDVAGTDHADARSSDRSGLDASGTVTVGITGPVARVVVEHGNSGGSNSGVFHSDIHFDAPTGIDAAGGDDVISGGAGADRMFGEGGDDTFVFAGAAEGQGDVLFGGNGPDMHTDHDVLDLRGAGAVRILQAEDASDFGATAGTVTFADGGTLTFGQIEAVLADEFLF
ncbi:hypothetical protein FDP22_08625 [Paroceanicella profunda]|uniref:Calcium-binding protein n=1 Tax=Paroceanicella profunda TaxID=2579971 RepID=A0A5B8FZ05_9RHOB|nr:hypothetical protein [Paroceanicella profunda]QDL91832.1 hypothetical protein FDP22_08625 [Paroceanicella profunda]